MRIAVITGASAGMGREFAVQLDRQRKYDEIWVIARREDRLLALRGALRAKVRPIPLDLTEPGAVEQYAALLEQTQPLVQTLVNAAGFGLFGKFTDLPLDEQMNMVDLNCKALAAMTYVTMPYMEPGGEVYEFASIASMQPIPDLNIYAATKAFVRSFSRALNRELALDNRGIRVMAICPCWVETEFFDRANRYSTIPYFSRIWDPRDVVRTAMRDMARGKDVSVHGGTIKAQYLMSKLLPHKLVMDIWCKQQNL